jgi:DNA N-6-adenine-methyltransferase (Dam)
VLGVIDLDPCADPGRRVAASHHLTKNDDGLSVEWSGRVFMNPPYRKGKETRLWVEKLLRHFEVGDVEAAVVLIPARTDTGWFALLDAYPRCFVRGRLKFSGHENSAPFPSAVVYMGDDKAAFIEAFRDLGAVFERVGA